MMTKKDDVSALATGWLTIPAEGDLRTKKSADGYACRLPTRSVRFLMAPRCSDPNNKGDLVIPVCHNRTSVDGVDHPFC